MKRPLETEDPVPISLPPELIIEIVRQSKWTLSGRVARCSKAFLYIMTRKEALCEIIATIKASESRRLFEWLFFPLPSRLAPFEFDGEGDPDRFIVPMDMCARIASASAVPQDIVLDECLFTGTIMSTRVYGRIGVFCGMAIHETSSRHVALPRSSGPVRGLECCRAVSYEHHFRQEDTTTPSSKPFIVTVFAKQELSIDQVGQQGNVFYQSPLAIYTYHTHDIICVPSEITRSVYSVNIPVAGYINVDDTPEPFWTVVERHLTGDHDNHSEIFHRCKGCANSLRNIFWRTKLKEWSILIEERTKVYTDHSFTYCRAPLSFSSPIEASMLYTPTIKIL